MNVLLGPIKPAGLIITRIKRGELESGQTMGETGVGGGQTKTPGTGQSSDDGSGITWYNARDYCSYCQGEGDSNVAMCKHIPNNICSTEKVLPSLEFDPNIDCSANKEKKRKKRLPNYICTTHCKYDVVRYTALKFGMRESSDNWNILWTDFTITCERAKNLKRYQKINHFPGMTEICRKDYLARNLNRMWKIFPEDYNFFPRTWCLPADLADVSEYARNHKHKTFILKPDIGCKGRGIQLIKFSKDLSTYENMICQVYISRPFLIDGYKFDLRVYTLITSCDPLRIYVYNEGLARFATKRYKEPTKANISNMYMHLTNYSVNKYSRTFIADPEAGSKRRISTVNQWLDKQLYDVDKIWEHIDDVIIKTILLAQPTLKHNYRASFPRHNNMQACFELLGFDLLLDHTLKPFLLEVNHSPSFHTDAPLDREVKEALITDTFTILNLPLNNRKKILSEERQKASSRLFKDSANSPKYPSCENENALLDVLREQDEWEMDHLGNFRRVYPCPSVERYDSFFCQGTSSLFNDTFSSRAREKTCKLFTGELQEKHEELMKMLKPLKNNSSEKEMKQEQILFKERNEDLMRMLKPLRSVIADKDKENRDVTKETIRDEKIIMKEKKEEIYKMLRPLRQMFQEKETKNSWRESKETKEGGKEGGKETKEIKIEEVESKPKSRTDKHSAGEASPHIARKRPKTNSFEPTVINEEEERERIAGLRKRHVLIEQNGILEKVYASLKKAGQLRIEDEIKYGRSNEWSWELKREARTSLQECLSNVIQVLSQMKGEKHTLKKRAYHKKIV